MDNNITVATLKFITSNRCAGIIVIYLDDYCPWKLAFGAARWLIIAAFLHPHQVKEMKSYRFPCVLEWPQRGYMVVLTFLATLRVQMLFNFRVWVLNMDTMYSTVTVFYNWPYNATSGKNLENKVMHRLWHFNLLTTPGFFLVIVTSWFCKLLYP